MLYSVKGKLIHTEPSFAVIECGGVGYKCLTTLNTRRELPPIGSETMLYTYMNVRENAVELFGFATMTELNCYKMLTDINGVGPKVGIAILSELSAEQVAMAIVSSDSKTLTRAAGVGNKLAQRIILELKDKLKGFTVAGEGFSPSVGDFEDTGNIPKAVGALAVLGYSSADVTPILSRLDSSLTVEQLIGLTLKQIGHK